MRSVCHWALGRTLVVGETCQPRKATHTFRGPHTTIPETVGLPELCPQLRPDESLSRH